MGNGNRVRGGATKEKRGILRKVKVKVEPYTTTEAQNKEKDERRERGGVGCSILRCMRKVLLLSTKGVGERRGNKDSNTKQNKSQEEKNESQSSRSVTATVPQPDRPKAKTLQGGRTGKNGATISKPQAASRTTRDTSDQGSHRSSNFKADATPSPPRTR